MLSSNGLCALVDVGCSVMLGYLFYPVAWALGDSRATNHHCKWFSTLQHATAGLQIAAVTVQAGVQDRQGVRIVAEY